MSAFTAILPDLVSGHRPSIEQPDEFIPLFSPQQGTNEFVDLFGKPQEATVAETSTIDDIAEAMGAIDDLIPEQPDLPPAQDQGSISLAEHEAVISDISAHHADMLEELKQDQIASLADSLDEFRSQVATDVARLVSETVGKALEPLARTVLTEESITQFVSQVEDVINTDSVGELRVFGSQELVDRVAPKMEGLHATFEVDENRGLDVAAQFNETVISTRLDELVQELSGALKC